MDNTSDTFMPGLFLFQGNRYEKVCYKVTDNKKSRNKKDFYDSHADEIKKHLEAKAAFDALDGKQIPKVKQLSEKYAELLAEKKSCYEEYKKARKEMVDYQNAKQNIDRILGLEPPEKEQRKRQETGR